MALATLELSRCFFCFFFFSSNRPPESIGQLAALAALHLGGCGALTALPESLGRHVAFARLYFSAATD
jgi:hypothetical protein